MSTQGSLLSETLSPSTHVRTHRHTLRFYHFHTAPEPGLTRDAKNRPVVTKPHARIHTIDASCSQSTACLSASLTYSDVVSAKDAPMRYRQSSSENKLVYLDIQQQQQQAQPPQQQQQQQQQQQHAD